MKIVQNRDDCIGCAACVAIHPEGWEMNDDGKSDLKGGVKTGKGVFEKKVTNLKDIEHHREAAESCPTAIIHVIDDEKQ